MLVMVRHNRRTWARKVSHVHLAVKGLLLECLDSVHKAQFDAIGVVVSQFALVRELVVTADV